MKKTSESVISGGQMVGSAKIIRQMYPATCSQCKKACEVPFVPSPDKPTYCKECFEKRKLAAKAQAAAQQHANNPIRNGNSSGDIKQQLSAINSKLDRLVQMLGTKESAPAKVEATTVPASAKKTAKPARSGKIAAKKKAVPKKK